MAGLGNFTSLWGWNGFQTLRVPAVCNLYSITTNQEAIRVMNRYVGNLAPMPGVPDYPAPVIRNTDTGTEMMGHAATAAHGWPADHQQSAARRRRTPLIIWQPSQRVVRARQLRL